MNEYRISVSLNGVFLFRSDWDQDRTRVINSGTLIKASISQVVVSLEMRDATFISEQL